MTAIDLLQRLARVKLRMAPRRTEHEFTIDVRPDGRDSRVLLDGVDISGLLMGVEVRSYAREASHVTLYVSAGKRATLVSLIPASQIVLHELHRCGQCGYEEK